MIWHLVRLGFIQRRNDALRKITTVLRRYWLTHDICKPFLSDEERRDQRLVCASCGGDFKSPACSRNGQGWSGHTVAGNGGRPVDSDQHRAMP